MTVQQPEDRFWELIIKRIEEEKCVLILGPDISLDGRKTLNEQLKDYLDTNTGKKYHYYIDDEFYSFADETDKEYAVYDIQKFFSQLSYSDIHSQIAEIPFHIIISVSPDLRMKKAFEDKGIEPFFDFSAITCLICG